MTRSQGPIAPRSRGSIDELPSGALRVRVYAGRDPVSQRRHDLIEIVAPGPGAAKQARRVRDRLISQVEERRNPRTKATVDQLLERYLDQFDGAASTLTLYRGYVRNHISPFLGKIKVGALDADTLDAFYAELRRCRDHCSGRPFVQHRTAVEHCCDQRCGQHRCQPLGATTIRHMHFILSGAYKRAVRWKWVRDSPLRQAEPPAAPVPNPHPPSAAEAARIVNEAWKDPDWGTFIWLAMTTGARRGELCALRWSRIDLTPDRAVMWLRRAISKGADGWAEGDLKTHQQRRVALDPETVEVLSEHQARCRGRAEALGVELAADAFVFSGAPDGSTYPTPGALTQRYNRLAERLGIDTNLHKLRHYSATELVAAGVDVRTVAGRLGHSGGGTTTLRTYAAWVSEADQRAAGGIATRMPSRPAPLEASQRAHRDPQSPYEKIAAKLRDSILSGDLVEGDFAPTEKQLAEENQVSIGTAHRAMELLKTWGFIRSSRGRRAIIVCPPELLKSVIAELPGKHSAPGARALTDARPPDEPNQLPEAATAARLWAVTLRGPSGCRYPARHVCEDINRPDSFRAHLLAIARIEGLGETNGSDGWIGNYELEIREFGKEDREPILTLRWQH
ncbi:MAG TPA: tyrosine-type recombinase/integrase [Pseudonocardiaceae bacterium]|nr:tyrosine-type recombinase/integrase [Pseudonocardiaceae bacterium]